MNEQERKELAYKMVAAMLHEDDFVKMARAALAVAEPAIREECAKICDRRYMGDNNREDMEARRCAAAIREGGKDG